ATVAADTSAVDELLAALLALGAQRTVVEHAADLRRDPADQGRNGAGLHPDLLSGAGGELLGELAGRVRRERLRAGRQAAGAAGAGVRAGGDLAGQAGGGLELGARVEAPERGPARGRDLPGAGEQRLQDLEADLAMVARAGEHGAQLGALLEGAGERLEAFGDHLHRVLFDGNLEQGSDRKSVV